MKLFWRSIAFLAVASVAPLAFGQTTTTWLNSGTLDENQSGNFNDPTKWTNNIIPSSTVAGLVQVLTFGSTDFGSNSIAIAVPVSQSAAALTLEQEEFNVNSQGAIDLNIANGVTLTLGSGLPASLSSDEGVATTISGTAISGGGAVNVISGAWQIGNFGDFYYDHENDVLNLSQLTVTFGSNNSISVTAENEENNHGTAALNQTATSITTGGTFTINIGTDGGNFFGTGGGNGTYNLTNGSSLSVGANSVLNIGTGIVNQDSTSTISMGTGSTVNVGQAFEDIATYNLAGNLTMTTGTINVGTDLSTGTLTQTGGTISGAINLVIGDDGTGVYNLQGGSATFSQGLTVGADGGSGSINQTSGSLTLAGTTVALIGVGGTGTYQLQSGSVDFQGGFDLGSEGTLNQTGGTLSSEGVTTISGTYIAAGSSATFTGSLTVNGELDVNSGTLTVGRDQLQGDGTINFGGGTLALTGGTGATYNYNFAGSLTSGTSTIDVSGSSVTGTFNFTQPLTGAGGISLVGNGNTDFYFADTYNSTLGNNTYSGSTAINGGTLFATQADLTNGSTSGSALTVGSTGTLNLTLDSAQVGMAYLGPISGQGTIALNFNSTGTQTFVMPNASGFDGTLALGANGNAGTLQVYNGTYENITDNGTGSSVTVGGTTVLDSNVPTSGTVLLPGANTYTGLTKINSGFTVAANHFSGDVSYSGALATSTYPLGGGHSTPSSLTILGTLNAVQSPLLGAAPPTLLIFTNGQTADTFYVNNNGNAADTSTISGLISVKGSGTNTYDVVQATTGTLTLGSVTTNPAGSLFSYRVVGLVDNDTKLEIATTQNLLSVYAQTPAQRAVAASLDPLTQAPPTAFAPLLTVFNSLSGSDVSLALGQLSPQSLQFTRDIAFENSTFLVQRLDGVLSNLRSGYAGLDLNGVSCTLPGFESGLGQSMQSMLASNAPNFHTTAPNGVNYYPDDGTSTPTAPGSRDYEQPAAPSRMTPSQSASPTTSDGQVLSDSPVPMGSATPPDIRTSRFSEFVAGDVALADINQNAAQDIPSKVTYTSGGVTAGVSYRMTSNLSAGVLLDYNHTYAKTDGNGSNTTVNSITPGVYATFFEKGFYVNGLFAFGFNNYHNNRDVSFLGGTATSAPKGQQYTANLDAGYDFHPSKEWVVGPMAGLTYTHLNIDSFSESGVPLANLNVNSQSYDSLRSHLGAHVQYQTRVGSVVLQPNLTAIWQHEFLNDAQGITSSFQDYATAAPFTTPMAATTTDSALLGAGLTATLDNSMAFFLNYLADVGGNDYLTQSIVGGVKASF